MLVLLYCDATPRHVYIAETIGVALIDDGQQVYLKKASETARFAYDGALAEWNRRYVEHKEGKRSKPPDEGRLRKQLDGMKAERSPWMREVTKSAPQEAIIDLGKASKRYLDHLKRLKTPGMRGKVPRAAHPAFKKNGVHDSFSISNDQIETDGNHLWIPKLGWVRMFESIRSSGPIKIATTSRTADRCYPQKPRSADDAH